jgi:hypothetical protein
MEYKVVRKNDMICLKDSNGKLYIPCSVNGDLKKIKSFVSNGMEIDEYMFFDRKVLKMDDVYYSFKKEKPVTAYDIVFGVVFVVGAIACIANGKLDVGASIAKSLSESFVSGGAVGSLQFKF